MDGMKFDTGKPRLDLVPPEIIEAIGAVRTYGVQKYGKEYSYREVEPKRYRAALMRHLCAWLKNPFGLDEESGLPHLWHVACNVAFLIELDKKEDAGVEATDNMLLKSENDELKARLAMAEDYLNPLPFKNAYDEAIETSKTEAYKEFAERLKSYFNDGRDVMYLQTFIHYGIDRLVKEMTEVSDNA